MVEQKIIGKGTWIDKLASELLEREKDLGRNTDLLRVESGLGASGIPHIGSLGDAVRAYGVKLALENLGYKSELIAYSDDLDGLRKIPEAPNPLSTLSRSVFLPRTFSRSSNSEANLSIQVPFPIVSCSVISFH